MTTTMGFGGGGEDADPSKTMMMMTIAAPTGFAMPFPRQSAVCSRGGWGKGLSGSLADEGTTMWNSNHERDALATDMWRGAGTGGW
jgi:hypothetical protein